MTTRLKIVIVRMAVLCAFASGEIAVSFAGEPPAVGGYVCPPCYHVDSLFDTEIYEHDGECPVCGMSLIERRTLLDIDNVNLHAGSGNFLLKAGLAHPDKPIFVFYHKPVGFSPDSPILLVIPGAGRNGWAYRDAWIDASETHNVLILAPYYADDLYDFGAYHMGGVISDFELRNVQLGPDGSAPSRYYLNDEDIVLEPNNDKDKWIFRDFDLIFRHAVAATGSRRESYDIFGHSAGGQILHRMAIFKPDSKADRIVAANSGFYTLPTHESSLPFGLDETEVAGEDIALAFSKNLVLLLGELDNENETRGTMLHTPLADQQGPGRLSRGRYFYRESQQIAESMGAAFNWRLKVVKGVGHDQRLMGKAAAEVLYGSAEGRKDDATEILNELRSAEHHDVATEWMLLMLLDQQDDAGDLLRDYETGGVPYQLASWLVLNIFDPEPYPSLVQMLNREDVQRPPVTTLPFACRTARVGADE